MVIAQDHDIVLAGDSRRVVGRLFLHGETLAPRRSRAEIIADRVRALPDEVAVSIRAQLLEAFSDRHHDLTALVTANAEVALARAGETMSPDAPHFFLLGAVFTSEYAVEGAALCNPSAVADIDQSGVPAGQLRVIVSLRQIGEGHVSSLGFARAIVGPGRTWAFEERHSPLGTPRTTAIPDTWFAYDAVFDPAIPLSARVIMPVLEEEINGIEDARMVRFIDDDGSEHYRITYTAFDGRTIAPRILISRDLVSFQSHRLTGSAATHKGIAPFPRRIGGELYALVRSDGETNALAHSPDGLAWGREVAIRGPQHVWDLVQSGNCGSPIETPQGWLVLTHGVGPMRTYALGAVLLDLDDPTRVVGILDEPLLESLIEDSTGYVPHVIYSCGGLIHDGIVWVPYGIEDKRVRVASIAFDELLAAMH